MRPALLLPLLLLAACQKGPVSQRPPTSAELAQVVGQVASMVQTLEIKPPRGARSFRVSPGGGGELRDFLKDGRLHLTVGVLQTGCPEGQYRLVAATVGMSGSSCLKLSLPFATTASLPTTAKPLPLNRWVPVYAVQPAAPRQRAGSRMTDENPAHWTLVSVYFSDQTNVGTSQVPDERSAAELLR